MLYHIDAECITWPRNITKDFDLLNIEETDIVARKMADKDSDKGVTSTL